MNWIIKVFNSLLSYSGWVTCVVYVVKKINNKNDIRMRVWLGTSTIYIKKIIQLLVFPSKTIWELYSLFTPIMYKLMGNGGL